MKCLCKKFSKEFTYKKSLKYSHKNIRLKYSHKKKEKKEIEKCEKKKR